MKLIKFIPNLLTLLNLLSGCIAVCFAFANQIEQTFYFVLLGIGFDFFDGFAARLLKVQNELGKQLDSLAEMVTSGVVPGVVMCQMLSVSIYGSPLDLDVLISPPPYLAFLGFTITMASCYRLANFNIDENQKENFVGLPTPANTLLIVSLPFVLKFHHLVWLENLLHNSVVLYVLTALSCYLLNAKLDLFSLKFKTFGFKENKIRYVFLILCVVMIALLQVIAIPSIIVLYVVMSLIDKISKW